MRPHCYRLLSDHSVEPVYDVLEWAAWYESADRRVALDTIGSEELSTVFLGVDYNFFAVFMGEGEPLLFESCVFDVDGASHVQERYASWGEAVVVPGQAAASNRGNSGGRIRQSARERQRRTRAPHLPDRQNSPDEFDAG